jgi:FAD/FMN-containing dehydrogenase
MTVATRPATTTAGYLDGLRAQLDGALITPGHPGYDEARKVHDSTVDSQPLALVRATDAHDVATAVAFAREHGLPLAVRSGGHDLARHSMPDDTLVVDLSAMNHFSIDPMARVARVQPAVTSGVFGKSAAALGLAISTGDTATVGFGGLTTGAVRACRVGRPVGH